MRLLSKNEAEKDTYYCPMKCEGEKTYSAPGNCPVCNMKLVPVTG
jgi:Cu2+-exporting ATPase